MDINMYILAALVIVIAGLGLLLVYKMRVAEQLKRKMFELSKENEENERKNWERVQAINSQVGSQIQQLTHHFQSQINQLQGNVSGQVQKMAEQLNKNTFSINRSQTDLSAQLSASIQKQLSTMTQSLDSRLNRTTESIDKITQTHIKLIEETKGIQSVGKDIAELQRILKAPKLRGVLGELSLESLLSQIYPKEGFCLQHTFKNGVIADAVLKLKDDRLLVIDSKFAHSKFSEIIKCENDDQRKKLRREFMSDVKRHIDSISEKYILPDENTLDFALMYIPAENIYYEVIIRYQNEEKNLLDYAYQRKVFPVSPNTLYAYLTTIAMGLRGLEVNKKAQVIIDYLGRLSQEYGKFRKEFNVLGGHINKTQSKYEDSAKRLVRFEHKMDQVHHLEGELKPSTKELPSTPSESLFPNDDNDEENPEEINEELNMEFIGPNTEESNDTEKLKVDDEILEEEAIK